MDDNYKVIISALRDQQKFSVRVYYKDEFIDGKCIATLSKSHKERKTWVLSVIESHKVNLRNRIINSILKTF